MSLKALIWVMEEAPVKNQGELCILYALADRADDRGRGAFPGHAWIAARARCSRRTVIRGLKRLEAAGVIRRGDQRLVDHYRSDRRPTVWDLAMDSGVPAGVDQWWEDGEGDGLEGAYGVSEGYPVDPHEVSNCHPVDPHEVSNCHPVELTGCQSRPHGVTQVSHKPSYKPSKSKNLKDVEGEGGVGEGETTQPHPPRNQPTAAPAHAGPPAIVEAELLDPPEPQTPRTSRDRTRLPDDWYPTQASIDRIRQDYPNVTPDFLRREHGHFTDYWVNIPGQKGKKANWDATWRNWMRRALDSPRKGNTTGRPRGTHAQDWLPTMDTFMPKD